VQEEPEARGLPPAQTFVGHLVAEIHVVNFKIGF
jgi:hypothetical protein